MRYPYGNSTLRPFTVGDGANLALQEWPEREGSARRGMVVLVHGLGEHAGRYHELACHLNHWGFAVQGYDQHGHGESDGVRGGLPTATRLVDDLAEVVACTRRRLAPGEPLIVLGHSLGGLVAASAVAEGAIEADGLVLSSPAFDAGLNAVQKLLIATLPRIAPNLRMGNGLNPQFLSHDPEVVAFYRADPMVHDRISARLARFLVEAGPRVIASAGEWAVPTLLMYAGADKLVSPRGSRAFAAAAPPGLVTAKCFDNLFHEIFNEQDAEPVFGLLKRWLDERF